MDWIDAKGKILGQLNKRFAHQHGLYHAVAHVYVMDSKDRLVLQQRSKKVLLAPGMWDDSVGGHIGAGELPEESARREAKEEVNATGKLHFLGHAEIREITRHYNNHERVYYYWMKTHARVRPQPGEVQRLARVPLEEVDAFFAAHPCTPWLTKNWKRFGKTIVTAVRPRRG